jgi:protein-S-isoprenylcysteine O-methyltransferase Ste14
MLVLTAWPFEYGAPLTEVLILIIGVIAIRQRIRYEEVELMALYGDDYAQYMRETDRILPNVW